MNKKEKEGILLSKIPTLNNYFNQVSKINTDGDENNILESTTDISNSNNSSTSPQTQYFPSTSTSETVVNENDDTEIISSSFTNNSDSFKDPAEWLNNSICRNYIAKFGYNQNADVDFTLSKRS